jgi:hypothetical protein
MARAGVLSVLLLLLLAGCAGTPTKSSTSHSATGSAAPASPAASQGAPANPPSSSSPTSSTPTTSPTSSGTQPPSGSASTPPLRATLTASATSGTAPLRVNFTLQASGGSSAPKAWTFQPAAGAPAQNGTSLPATVEATYDTNGTYTATLTVTQGDAHATANLTVRVLAQPPVVLTAKVTLPCLFCEVATDGPETQCTGASGDGPEAPLRSCASFPLANTTWNHLFTATASAGDVAVVFAYNCEGVGNSFEQHRGTGDEAGIIPEGAMCAYLWEDSQPNADVTLRIP